MPGIISTNRGAAMPLREINAIEKELDMYINYTMKNAYDLASGDVLVLEVRRHFDESKKFLNEINQVVEVELQHPRWINIARDLKGIGEKFNVKEDDYLEVIYMELKREGEAVEIFPGENKEYLDFDPDKED
jgi:hypothetical protein